MTQKIEHDVTPGALSNFSATKEKVLDIKKYLPGLLMVPVSGLQELIGNAVKSNIDNWKQLPETTANELWEKLQFVFATAYVKKLYNDEGVKVQYDVEMCEWCTNAVLLFHKMVDSKETFKLSINHKVLEQFKSDDEKFEMYKQITRAIYSRAWSLFKHGFYSDAYMSDVLLLLLMLTGQIVDTRTWVDIYGKNNLSDSVSNAVGTGYFK